MSSGVVDSHLPPTLYGTGEIHTGNDRTGTKRIVVEQHWLFTWLTKEFMIIIIVCFGVSKNQLWPLCILVLMNIASNLPLKANATIQVSIQIPYIFFNQS